MGMLRRYHLRQAELARAAEQAALVASENKEIEEPVKEVVSEKSEVISEGEDILKSEVVEEKPVEKVRKPRKRTRKS